MSDKEVHADLSLDLVEVHDDVVKLLKNSIDCWAGDQRSYSVPVGMGVGWEWV